MLKQETCLANLVSETGKSVVNTINSQEVEGRGGREAEGMMGNLG